ncbi:MAG: branched-chain amino acid ABC transporter permease [Armatimonadota bacterium]|nr:branched-chain amino acid ABC transporter permease [Armatimonadota bacterium]
MGPCPSRRPAWWLVPLAAFLLALPVLVRALASGMANYLLSNFAIQSLVWVALALSYDLSVGHAGTVTLAHPAFLGIGAYTAGVLSTRLGMPFLLNVLIAMFLAGAVAFLVGIPFFRLSDVFFAIGTLGFAFMAQIVAVNWQDVTRGALCITRIPRPEVALGPLSFRVADLTGFYYLSLTIATATCVTYLAITTGRVGRALAAVRGDEGLAQTFALNPLLYKMLAFVVGAMLASLIGVFQAHYVTVLCPDILGTFFTLNLLIVVFLGGVGSLRGVILGAVLFTIIPELARFAQVWAQLVYGVVLLAVVLYAPDGVEGVVRRALHRTQQRVSIWRRSAAEEEPADGDRG